MRALLEGRDNNLAHEESFNSLITGLKKKIQCWDKVLAKDLSMTSKFRGKGSTGI